MYKRQYANCGLPSYIGGTIQNEKALTLQTPESFKRRFNVDVRVQNEVLAIRPEQKSVTVRRLSDGTTYEESYDKLILDVYKRQPLCLNLDGNAQFLGGLFQRFGSHVGMGDPGRTVGDRH